MCFTCVCCISDSGGGDGEESDNAFEKLLHTIQGKKILTSMHIYFLSSLNIHPYCAVYINNFD